MNDNKPNIEGAREQAAETNKHHNLHSEMDKFVHAYLLNEGWEESAFGVISAEYEGGSCNLTYVISHAIEAYLAKQHESALSVVEQKNQRLREALEDLMKFVVKNVDALDCNEYNYAYRVLNSLKPKP